MEAFLSDDARDARSRTRTGLSADGGDDVAVLPLKSFGDAPVSPPWA